MKAAAAESFEEEGQSKRWREDVATRRAAN